MKIIFKLLISIVLIAICLSRIDLHEIPIVFSNINYLPLIFLFISVFFHLFFLLKRWQQLNKELQVKNNNGYNMFKAVYFGYALNQILPTTIGGDTYRFSVLKQVNNSIKSSLISLLIDRLIGLYFVILFSLLGSFFLIQISSIFAYLSLILFLIIITIGMVDIYQTKITFIKNEYIKFILEALCLTNKIFRSPLKNKILNFSILSKFFNLLFVLLSLYAFDVQVTLGLIFVFPIIILFSYLPISFAGWGLREGTFIYFLSFFNINSTLAFSVSIYFGFIQVLIALIIFISYFFLSFKKNE